MLCWLHGHSDELASTSTGGLSSCDSRATCVVVFGGARQTSVAVALVCRRRVDMDIVAAHSHRDERRSAECAVPGSDMHHLTGSKRISEPT